MPLSSLSAPEGEKFLAAAQRADSNLLRALSEHFLVMAAVEESDPRRPDIEKLRTNSASHFFAMTEYLDASIEAAQEMLSTIPSKGSSEMEAMVRFRVQTAIEKSRNFQRAASVIAKQIHASNPGSYPRMAACEDVLKALQDLIATFRQNAQFHLAKGL
jgi:hypothetical protein